MPQCLSEAISNFLNFSSVHFIRTVIICEICIIGGIAAYLTHLIFDIQCVYISVVGNNCIPLFISVNEKYLKWNLLI